MNAGGGNTDRRWTAAGIAGRGAPTLPARFYERPRVFLVGFMAAGKTTVGRVLARALDFEFKDLDREVEGEANRTIAAIFAEDGEEAFRRRETEALGRLCAGPRVVVATGGGAFVSAANAALIAHSGWSVWLDVPWEVALARLARSAGSRPLFSDPEAALRLYESRVPAYRRADLHLLVSGGEGPRAAAGRILSMIGALARRDRG